jgi:bifunctional non-homologous end joining protein LigD
MKLHTANRTLPTVEPVVPVSGSPPLQDPAWLYEPKFDGLRGVLYQSPQTSFIRSKRGSVLRRFSELCERVRADLKVRDVILDGEVVAINDEGHQDVQALLAGRGWLHYTVFDLLWINGRDLSRQSLTVRKRRLAELIPESTHTVTRVLTVDGDGRGLFEAVERLDLEGIVAKRKADFYGPRTVWYTLKNPGYTRSEGRWELFERKGSAPASASSQQLPEPGIGSKRFPRRIGP